MYSSIGATMKRQVATSSQQRDQVESEVRLRTLEDVRQWIGEAQDRITAERNRFRRYMFTLVGVSAVLMGLVVYAAFAFTTSMRDALDAEVQALRRQVDESRLAFDPLLAQASE